VTSGVPNGRNGVTVMKTNVVDLFRKSKEKLAAIEAAKRLHPSFQPSKVYEWEKEEALND
jgi:hypothetical protein